MLPQLLRTSIFEWGQACTFECVYIYIYIYNFLSWINMRRNCTFASRVRRSRMYFVVPPQWLQVASATPSDVSSQSEPRICTSCLSFTAGEIPASNFLARRAACRRAHHNHRLANLCTSNMAAAVVGAEHQRCRVFGSTKPAHGDGSRCCQQLFSNTQIFPCRFYIFFLPSPFFRSCISILFHASSPPPPHPFFFLSALHAS